ncbi:MAG: ABC transporter substrate-binding protein [Oscillospiraceae bacterium]|nr:ABC transporter substrate-binding protein [Oscillospiraceae bacterium]
MKRIMIIVMVAALMLGLCACIGAQPTTSSDTKPADTTAAPVETDAAATAGTTAETAAATQSAETAGNSETQAPTESASTDAPVLRIYSLKGPTSMGLATLLQANEAGQTQLRYDSTICTAADEVTAALVNGSADIALLPANAAATLFNKAGGFSVVAINTLGVLYVVENGESVQSVKDLAGKTICLTGKGTTPEYALRYLLAANGIEDQVTLEFKSEAQEVVTAMSEDLAMIGLLPQPFVTAAMMQNENLRIALDLNSEWNSVSTDSAMVTGVTVVRNEILEQYPEQIQTFLAEAAEGVDQVNDDPEAAAELIVNMEIVAKAPIAAKAIPYCNLVCITGEGMKSMLSGYLQTLYEQNPKAVGESMPSDDFYYTGE